MRKVFALYQKDSESYEWAAFGLRIFASLVGVKVEAAERISEAMQVSEEDGLAQDEYQETFKESLEQIEAWAGTTSLSLSTPDGENYLLGPMELFP